MHILKKKKKIFLSKSIHHCILNFNDNSIIYRINKMIAIFVRH